MLLASLLGSVQQLGEIGMRVYATFFNSQLWVKVFPSSPARKADKFIALPSMAMSQDSRVMLARCYLARKL